MWLSTIVENIMFINLTPFVPLMIGIYIHIMERGKRH